MFWNWLVVAAAPPVAVPRAPAWRTPAGGFMAWGSHLGFSGGCQGVKLSHQQMILEFRPGDPAACPPPPARGGRTVSRARLPPGGSRGTEVRPGPSPPHFSLPRLLREQWIRAKYERQEFTHPERQEPYSAGEAAAPVRPSVLRGLCPPAPWSLRGVFVFVRRPLTLSRLPWHQGPHGCHPALTLDGGWGRMGNRRLARDLWAGGGGASALGGPQGGWVLVGGAWTGVARGPGGSRAWRHHREWGRRRAWSARGCVLLGVFRCRRRRGSGEAGRALCSPRSHAAATPRPSAPEPLTRPGSGVRPGLSPFHPESCHAP